jgi:hypothetical protein
VPTARDKLIAEWQDRLAAAEAADLSSPGRPAWLARLQIRLYRFLLSLYGDSDWTTTPPRRLSRKSDADGSGDSVIFDSHEASLLCGKPAKSAGKIQAVLKSVANAQDGPLQAGPLVAQNWVKIAGARPHETAQSCAEFFRARGICARAVDHGDESSIEVSAFDCSRAVAMLPSIVSAMSSPRRAAEPRRDVVWRGGPPTAFTNFLVVAVMVGPIFAMFLTLTTSVIAAAVEGRLVNIDQGSILLASWMAITIAAAITYLTPLATWLGLRRRPVLSSDSRVTQSQD